MKDIKYWTTKELFDELKNREGVELILVDVTDNCEVIVDNEYGVCTYTARRSGPEMILRIID